jgi:hypothetical protein
MVTHRFEGKIAALAPLRMGDGSLGGSGFLPAPISWRFVSQTDARARTEQEKQFVEGASASLSAAES